VVLPERGHLKPGMLVVGGDSHSPTGGAFGAYMFGDRRHRDGRRVLATGEIWIKVPGTIMIEWQGRLSPGVLAKDMMLKSCTGLGMDGGQYQAVEYAGPAVRALSMQERMTLSNMAAELGAQAGPDRTGRNDGRMAARTLADRTGRLCRPHAPIPGAALLERITSSTLPPRAAGSRPALAGQCRGCRRSGGRADRCRLCRRLHRREICRPEGGSGNPEGPQGRTRCRASCCPVIET
jgi:3-isopropylmalate/(R)-2-methylmalate dehydratase large subunit